MPEASFALKLWGATYYMTASMVVQLMNKVSMSFETPRADPAAERLSTGMCRIFCASARQAKLPSTSTCVRSIVVNASELTLQRGTPAKHSRRQFPAILPAMFFLEDMII